MIGKYKLLQKEQSKVDAYRLPLVTFQGEELQGGQVSYLVPPMGSHVDAGIEAILRKPRPTNVLQKREQRLKTAFDNREDSQLSDECIDFTMMCVFFCVSATTFWSSKMSPVSDRKVNPVGTYFEGVKSKKCPIVFKSVRKNPKKSNRKTGIFTQNQFSTKSTFLYGCKSKTNHCKYLKFSPKVPYEFSNIDENSSKP
ncbi:Uncharacterized protein FWK35_00004070 [Aphis craccivora]|uniref:Uncharacterized protein n=1 Tax=Aphis craccivora TaxID=307492 RepID=A0A6G0ZR57_APHCR|nr:Uncharacterized protein FWK35_00004070 [Aphis craccivora]